jgi:lysophospholipase L1-like esterase
MSSYTYTYLALGDSYSIGEGVPLYDSFPYQTVQLLRRAGYAFQAAEIVAKTGWTTDELQAGINAYRLLPQYDFVSLLIGVNNQYRGRDIFDYTTAFESLLQQAIRLAGNKASRVFVLSIPDWGVTPFGKQQGAARGGNITDQINAFNAVNQNLAEQYNTPYIDITPGTREAATDETLLTTDQLHPSGSAYAQWATQLAAGIAKESDFLLI